MLQIHNTYNPFYYNSFFLFQNIFYNPHYITIEMLTIFIILLYIIYTYMDLNNMLISLLRYVNMHPFKAHLRTIYLYLKRQTFSVFWSFVFPFVFISFFFKIIKKIYFLNLNFIFINLLSKFINISYRFISFVIWLLIINILFFSFFVQNYFHFIIIIIKKCRFNFSILRISIWIIKYFRIHLSIFFYVSKC